MGQVPDNQDRRTTNTKPVELLQADLVGPPSANKQLLMLAGIVLIMAIFFTGWWFYNRQKAEDSASQVKDNQKQLDTLTTSLNELKRQEKILTDKANVIKTISVLLRERISWPKVLERVEATTLKNAYYNSLSLSRTDKEISLNLMVRAKNFASAVKQVEAFKQDTKCVINVEITNFNLSEEEVSVSQPKADPDEAPAKVESYLSSFVEFPVQVTYRTDCFSGQ